MQMVSDKFNLNAPFFQTIVIIIIVEATAFI